MKVQRVQHNTDNPEIIYKINDDTTIQGVFFLVVDQEEKTITVQTIDLNGLQDEADTLLISSRIPLEEPEVDEDGAVWRYLDDKDLSNKLLGILGDSAAIVLTDLGVSGNKPDDWDTAVTTGDEPADTALPDIVAVGSMEFEFDPDEVSQDGDGAGGTTGDDGFGSDNPDELEDPLAEPEDDAEAGDEDNEEDDEEEEEA